jgi:hypothetical protein
VGPGAHDVGDARAAAGHRRRKREQDDGGGRRDRHSKGPLREGRNERDEGSRDRPDMRPQRAFALWASGNSVVLGVFGRTRHFFFFLLSCVFARRRVFFSFFLDFDALVSRSEGFTSGDGFFLISLVVGNLPVHRTGLHLL